MDTKEFLIEYKRICNNHESCLECPLDSKCCWKYENIEEIIEIVEKWAKENPKKENEQ